MSNDLLERAQRLVNEYGAEELLSIELTNITPALVGSWNATRYTDPDSCLVEPPRPTDIAGKTRWWLRTILAAGIYEQYGLHAPTYLLDEIASQIMGSVGDKGQASKIQIVTEPLHDHRAYMKCIDTSPCKSSREVHKEVLNILKNTGTWDTEQIAEECSFLNPEMCCRVALASPRILLSLLNSNVDARKIPLPPGFYQFRLRVIWRPGSQSKDIELEQRLLGLALGLAVFFTGIGRATTRGYGKLAPLGLKHNNFVINGNENPLVEEFINVWNVLVFDSDPMYTLASRATCLASSYIKRLCTSRNQHINDKIIIRELQKLLGKFVRILSIDTIINMPLQETFHTKYIIERTFDTYHTSNKLGRYCNNNAWCLVALISEAVKRDNIGALLHVLGLPRGQLEVQHRGRKHEKSKSVKRLLSQVQFSIVGYQRRPLRLIILGFKSILLDILATNLLGYEIKGYEERVEFIELSSVLSKIISFLT